MYNLFICSIATQRCQQFIMPVSVECAASLRFEPFIILMKLAMILLSEVLAYCKRCRLQSGIDSAMILQVTRKNLIELRHMKAHLNSLQARVNSVREVGLCLKFRGLILVLSISSLLPCSTEKTIWKKTHGRLKIWIEAAVAALSLKLEVIQTCNDSSESTSAALCQHLQFFPILPVARSLSWSWFCSGAKFIAGRCSRIDLALCSCNWGRYLFLTMPWPVSIFSHTLQYFWILKGSLISLLIVNHIYICGSCILLLAKAKNVHGGLCEMQHNFAGLFEMQNNQDMDQKSIH